jgi:hypothetical protein
VASARQTAGRKPGERLGVSPPCITAPRASPLSIQSPAVNCPPAFVLDVGIIDGRGWAVVEFNECWASGIYACDPHRVLDTLLRACVPSNTLTETERQWDFRKHYFSAFP